MINYNTKAENQPLGRILSVLFTQFIAYSYSTCGGIEAKKQGHFSASRNKIHPGPKPYSNQVQRHYGIQKLSKNTHVFFPISLAKSCLRNIGVVFRLRKHPWKILGNISTSK